MDFLFLLESSSEGPARERNKTIYAYSRRQRQPKKGILE